MEKKEEVVVPKIDLAPLEAKLSKQQWLGGAKPSQEDLDQAKAVGASPVDVKAFPWVFAWLSLAGKLAKV
jgi:hypothetical protein